MNSFGPQRKRSYEFSFVCPCVCPRHKERFCEDFFFFFFIFDSQDERGLVNSVPLVLPLVPSFFIKNGKTISRFF